MHKMRLEEKTTQISPDCRGCYNCQKSNKKANRGTYCIPPSPACTASDRRSLAAIGCDPRTLSKMHLAWQLWAWTTCCRWACRRSKRGCSTCSQKACAQPFGNHILNEESASFSTVIFSLLLEKCGSVKRDVTPPAKRTQAGLLRHLRCTFTHIPEQSPCGN